MTISSEPGNKPGTSQENEAKGQKDEREEKKKKKKETVYSGIRNEVHLDRGCDCLD
jgi:hypothetical protein